MLAPCRIASSGFANANAELFGCHEVGPLMDLLERNDSVGCDVSKIFWRGISELFTSPRLLVPLFQRLEKTSPPWGFPKPSTVLVCQPRRFYNEREYRYSYLHHEGRVLLCKCNREVSRIRGYLSKWDSPSTSGVSTLDIQLGKVTDTSELDIIRCLDTDYQKCLSIYSLNRFTRREKLTNGDR
jgi:hypothetical protein